MYHTFNATNEPGTCLWCGRRIPKGAAQYYRFWDTKDCALLFATVLAKAGRRLTPVTRIEPTPEPMKDPS